MGFLRTIIKNIPTALLALVLAVAVWISAVIQTDPTQERVYPEKIAVDFIGQSPEMVLVDETPVEMTLTLSAPSSIWDRLINEQIPVRAVVDLAGLAPGDHSLPIQIQIGLRPVEIVSSSPEIVTITLENLAARMLPVKLITKGELGVGFQSNASELDPDEVTVSGPETLVKRVNEVRATLDLTGVKENLQRVLQLQAVDANGSAVSGVTITPEKINALYEIVQLGGYRNVVVKVILLGQVVNGYRVTNISVYPPAVTVFSADPKLVESLPGFIETMPLSLEGQKDDVDENLTLNLPSGITTVDKETVAVHVGVSSIEGSLTVTSVPVEIVGLGNKLKVKVAPETVDIYLTGPVPLLSTLNIEDIRVVVDLTDGKEGTYQRVPEVKITNSEIKVQSIIPGSVEITITPENTATSTPGS